MVAWVDFVEHGGAHARVTRAARRLAREPGPTRRSCGTGLPLGRVARAGCDQGPDDHVQRATRARVATAFLAALGAPGAPVSAGCSARHRDALRFEELAANVLEAWRDRVHRPRWRTHPDTQANHVRALAFGLVPDELRSRHGGAAGRADPRGRHAPRHRLPGHAVPAARAGGHRPRRRGLRVAVCRTRRRRGWPWSTAGRRRCGSAGRASTPTACPHESLNHYSKGAVISFLHNYVAGIAATRRPSPAYRHFRVEPRPGWRDHLGRGRARLARTAGSSRRGDVDAETFELDVTVPPGTIAEVVLPDGSERTVVPGRHRFGCVTQATTQ